MSESTGHYRHEPVSLNQRTLYTHSYETVEKAEEHKIESNGRYKKKKKKNDGKCFVSERYISTDPRSNARGLRRSNFLPSAISLDSL